MDVLRGDMTIIRDTRRGSLLEMVGTMESVSTIISAGAPSCRVVGGDDWLRLRHVTWL
jgi:hypothetical protein